MTDNIIGDWLKSISLEIYTEAFIDNGYDELEVCKQIGKPDLDAIGVTNEVHRQIILQAVTKIKEEGATSVYFTLETSDVAVIEPNLSEKQGPPNRRNSTNVEAQRTASRMSCVGGGGPEEMVTIYPRAQLRMIVRDKLVQDNIDLLSPPYTRRDWTACHSSMMTLAAKYAIQLRTRSSDVVERLEELRQWVLQKDLQSHYTTVPISPVSCSSGTSSPGCPNFPSPHTPLQASIPPALPDCPPPATSHLDGDRLGKLHTFHSRQDTNLYQSNYMTVGSDGQEGDKIKKTSSLGRFFRNMGIRRSGKKNQYKPHDGDLCATDMTMSDEDRKALMIMVKDGTLTTEQAMAMVKQYEEERRREWQQQQGNHKGAQKKKKQGGKPVKSPSATYHDITTRCQVCQRFLSNDPTKSSPNFCNDPSHRFECYQHRRVHSVSHIEFTPSTKSPEAARAMSCTPTRGFYGPSEVHSPVTFYSPGHPRLYSPVFPHDGKMYHTGSLCYGQHGNFYHGNGHHSSFHESPSAMSNFSMESEHSMECQTHVLTPGELSATRGDNWNYSTYSSAMSTGSDSSPAIGWRKNSEGGDPMKMQKVRNQSGTNKSVSSVESSQSGGSGNMSTHSASPGSGKSGSSMEAEGMAGNLDNTSSSLVRVHTDYTPSKTEVDMLHIKKGDIIWVATKTAGGLWKGVLSGKTGWFRPSYTEACSHSASEGSQRRTPNPRRTPRKAKPRTVEELLYRLGLESLEKVFLENGFEHLESFADLNESDLDALGIRDPQQRAKLLTAAELLCSAEDDEFPEVGSHNGLSNQATLYCYSPRLMTFSDCHHRTCPGSRDSGCYGSWEHLGHKEVFNKQGYMISAKNQTSRVSPLQYNKENLQPVNQNRTVGEIRYVCSRQANSSGRGSASSGRTSVENCGGESQTSDMERSDRDFTEEDREVCEINHMVRRSDPSCVHPGEHVTPSAEENSVFGDFIVVMCSNVGTQTSSSCDSEARCSKFTNQVNGHSYGATDCERSKPFPNKVVTKSRNSKKDAHVQVMCPFGPLSVFPEGGQNQSRQECVQRQRESIGGSSDSTPTGELQGRTSSQGAISNQEGQVQYSDKQVPKNGPHSVDISRPVSSPIDFRNVKKSLVSLITAKLDDENINLSQEPYSTKQGECQIPPLLIQRYSEELKQDVASVCTVLEQVRVHSLTSQHKPVIQMENLAEKCSTGSELKTSSIPDFLTSIGLPMYTSAVIGQNYKYLEQLFKLTNQNIRDITGASHKHAKRIAHALTWVKKKMASQASNDETGLIDRV
ncbi:SAM and SH3 domain-containing protein 1-like isoform X2 [Saccostrea echinata]|uniref:SAM and SH3 domain-containing protein 1-like isoform X2 n=1 Tax=Saccostrea echinata TaxID=191078 RepID=UPI002A8165A3|nr:SAM and SH3 domain-containing protein 1-like isoform X2 [Saccostrea echinata]